MGGQVLDFTERASQGVPCLYLRERNQLRVSAVYCLDATVRYLILLSGEGLQDQEVVCPVSSIVEICSFQEAGETCFPKAVVNMVELEEPERLIMVVFRRQTDQAKIRFCIVEETVQ